MGLKEAPQPDKSNRVSNENKVIIEKIQRVLLFFINENSPFESFSYILDREEEENVAPFEKIKIK